MAYDIASQASLLFATVASAAGVPLSVVAWRLFRGSPFGRALAVLPVFLALLAVYHPLLVLYPGSPTRGLLLESVAFASLLIFAAMMIRVHRRMRVPEG